MIYNIFDYYEKEPKETFHETPQINPDAFTQNRIGKNFIPNESSRRDQIFSAIAARFFFFLLLLGDLCWGVYSLLLFIGKGALFLVTLGQITYIRTSLGKSWLQVKRSLVCAIALFIALFSPALGIMFSCMYFLMYDKSGVDEIVPASLKEQFQEIFPTTSPTE